MNPSLARIFIKTLRAGKQLKLPSIHSNTYFYGDIETSALHAINTYNKTPPKLPEINSFKTMPSMYSNLYNSHEATEYFLKK